MSPCCQPTQVFANGVAEVAGSTVEANPDPPEQCLAIRQLASLSSALLLACLMEACRLRWGLLDKRLEQEMLYFAKVAAPTHEGPLRCLCLQVEQR